MKRRISTLLSILTLALCCMVATGAYAAGTSIADATVTLSKTDYTYDGTAKEPRVKVVLAGTTLVKDTDYTVSYQHNKNAGTATAVVKGAGTYSGRVNKQFTIARRDISSSKFKIRVGHAVINRSVPLDISYNGNKVYMNSSYTVKSKNVSRLGYNKGSITIRGTGNFIGTKSVRFTVHSPSVKGLKTTARDSSSVTVTWTPQKDIGITGYKVYTCDSKGDNRKIYATVKDNEAAILDMSSGKLKYILVRSYKTSADKTIYGDFSKVFAICCTPKRAVTSGAINTKKKDYVNVYVKQMACTGYQIKYATDKNFTQNVNTIEQTGSDKTKIKIKLNANKQYYFKARLFVRYNDGRTTVYGPWSGRATNKFYHVYSKFTTYYSTSDYNRCRNLATACKYINGTILLPGETFSFNEVVGPRTKKKGFREAGIFENGGHGTAVGGGICQVSTTLFNAALYGNFDIVMRRQHSQRVAYIPAGRDAAMYKKKKDFRFKNNTDHAILIKMSASGGHLTCKLVTCKYVNPKKVTLKVKKQKGKYVLRRYVDGKCNYVTKSKY